MVEQILASHSILVKIFLGLLIAGLLIPMLTSKDPLSFKKFSFIYTMFFQAIITMIAFTGLIAMVMGEFGFMSFFIFGYLLKNIYNQVCYKKNKMYAKRPKATYITASTQRTPDALYLKHWTKKIERIGNLNYPAQARKNKLEGQLILVVAISPSGDIINIRISQSSGHKTLDNAARKIVQLAAPYAAVPADVLRGNSRLVITRTWQFTHNSGKNFSSN